MSKEANLRHKSRKTAVLLYRAFLKLSLAGAIYAAYCVLRGTPIEESGFAIAVSIISAIAFEIAYYVYKSKKKEDKDVSKDMTWGQVIALTKMIGFLLGLFMLLYGASFTRSGRYYGIALMAVGLVLCHLLHNNKRVFSHLSTFSENAAAGFIVITLELIYFHVGMGTDKWLWAIGASVTVALYALTEVFFYFFNKQKHKGKASFKLLFLDRLAQFLRNSLVVIIVWIAWVLLIISGCVQFVIDLGVYDKAIAIIPIVISIVTPALDFQKQSSTSEKKPKMVKYDPRIPLDDFKKELARNFGEKARSLKALDYVTEKMSKENGMTRYNGEDYYVHPIAVAKILLDNTDADDDTVAAALLHDCIEDIDECTYDLIELNYNEKIAKLVQLVSKEKGKDYDDPAVIGQYIQNICTSIPATMIKIADRINNNSTMDNRTEADKAEKTKETKTYYKQLVYFAMPNDVSNRKFYRMAEEFFEQDIE